MNPYRPHRLMAAPPTLHARMEIAKAIDSLAAEEAGARARRRAEIGVIRRDLTEIPDLLRKALAEWRAELLAGLQKYNPDELRVPKGNPDGGEWTSESTDGSSDELSVGTPNSRSERHPRYAALDTSSGVTQADASPIFSGEYGTAATTTENSRDVPSRSSVQVADESEDDENETKIGGEVLELTAAQQVRLTAAQARFQYFLSRVRKIDPKWSPAPAVYELSVEGKIREMEVGAREAEQYLSRLRQLALPRDPRTGELILSREAKTGDPFIDYTTEKLQDILDEVIDKVGPRGNLSPQNYGTKVHVEFAKAVRAAGLRGIAPEDVERTFGVEPDAPYSAKHSIRTDAPLRDDNGNIIVIYDVKTGRGMRQLHAITIRLRTGSEATVPIIEIYPNRDPVWKLRRFLGSKRTWLQSCNP